MTSKEIRQAFLDYFASKGHQIVPSAPMVIKNDPTLMFTNAGMNQFKDIFLGNSPAKYKRIADTQKCLRVSGKHNDLEEVGLDTYHHTMFEMLGNWSFGDYFKKEAIEWAWELLTEVYKLPKDRLYVTVFEGDEKEKLEKDTEAFELWKNWIAEDRILMGNKKDNFWEMGETGPCGPCSEIHIDLRSDEDRAKIDGKTLVNESHPQVIEIWNNVFMEFNRMNDGKLVPLPAKHVDTGMGFERLCMAMQGKTSNYDTDVFQPMIQFICQPQKINYDSKEFIKESIAVRVMVDHIRAIAFSIADGQLPSNNKAGYVIRRILRRAVRYAYTFIGFKAPFLYKLVPLLAEQFDGVFPELKAQQDFIQKVIFEEEASFLRTLERGIVEFETKVMTYEEEWYVGSQNKVAKTLPKQTLEGKFVFDLYDTFGFPIDLTQLMARERGIDVDMEGFNKCMAEQKARSRNAATVETEDWIVLNEGETKFIGYEELEGDITILKYRKVKAKGKEQFQLVFDVTPFYAESGGQVGDTGFIENINEKIFITDTQKENNLIVHLADQLPESMTGKFHAVVNKTKRKLTENNHSATHLLHAALRQVLGKHVAQKGSLVNEEHTRFDFSHFSKVTDEELKSIEEIVNQKVRENITLIERRNVPIEEAKSMGAMALFGEKYGDFVRVITFDKDYSVELCGGTHVKATGQIGLFKIVSEAAVAAGVRRIEAITADKAEDYFNKQTETINQIKDLLKNPSDLIKGVQSILNENDALKKNIEAMINEKVAIVKTDLLAKIKNINGINFLAEVINLPSADAIKTLSYEMKNQQDNLLLVFGAIIDGKAHLSIIISENLLHEKSLDANKMIRDLAKDIQGGGGGQPFYATAGGKNPDGLKTAINRAITFIQNQVNNN